MKNLILNKKLNLPMFNNFVWLVYKIINRYKQINNVKKFYNKYKI